MRITSLTVLALLFVVGPVAAQRDVDLVEDSVYDYQGLQYGYTIANETSREVKGEEYERYQVKLFVSNTSGCQRLIPFGHSSGTTVTSNKGLRLAGFNCINANGKRLTAKKGAVHARIIYADVRIPDASAKEKYRVVSAQLGYGIRAGETVSNLITVLVPRGERPRISCEIAHLPADF